MRYPRSRASRSAASVRAAPIPRLLALGRVTTLKIPATPAASESGAVASTSPPTHVVTERVVFGQAQNATGLEKRPCDEPRHPDSRPRDFDVLTQNLGVAHPLYGQPGRERDVPVECPQVRGHARQSFCAPQAVRLQPRTARSDGQLKDPTDHTKGSRSAA